jgi:hypothetical protein
LLGFSNVSQNDRRRSDPINPVSQCRGDFQKFSALSHAGKRLLKSVLQIKDILFTRRNHIRQSRPPSGIGARPASGDAFAASPKLIPPKLIIASIVNQISCFLCRSIVRRTERLSRPNVVVSVQEIEPVEHLALLSRATLGSLDQLGGLMAPEKIF